MVSVGAASLLLPGPPTRLPPFMMITTILCLRPPHPLPPSLFRCFHFPPLHCSAASTSYPLFPPPLFGPLLPLPLVWFVASASPLVWSGASASPYVCPLPPLPYSLVSSLYFHPSPSGQLPPLLPCLVRCFHFPLVWSAASISPLPGLLSPFLYLVHCLRFHLFWSAASISSLYGLLPPLPPCIVCCLHFPLAWSAACASP